MGRHARHRPVSAGALARLVAVALLTQVDARAVSVEKVPDCIELVTQTAPGMRTTKDQPMSVLWLEDTDGRFVRTLWRFGRDKKWYKDLTVWHDLSAPLEKDADVDAVTGATIIQGDQGMLRLPTRWQGLDLLSGRYVLRVESRKDHSKHYSSMRIPLGPQVLGRPVADPGYVRTLELRRCAAGTTAPATIEAIVAESGKTTVQSPEPATGTREHP